MQTITSADFQRNIGHYQDRALVEPVLVTRNGRERLVLLSAEEFNRLKQRERHSLLTSQLSAADLAEIDAAEVPVEHAHLDSELGN